MTPCARRSFTAHPTITGYHWLRGRKQIFSGRLGFLFGPPQVPGEALCTRNLSVEARQPPRPLSPNLKGHLCSLFKLPPLLGLKSADEEQEQSAGAALGRLKYHTTLEAL